MGDFNIESTIALPADCSKLKLHKHERRWVGNQIVSNLQTIEGLHQRHNISKANLRRYAKQYREGRIFHESPGRPPILTEDGENLLAYIIEDRSLDVDQLSTNELRKLVILARNIVNNVDST